MREPGDGATGDGAELPIAVVDRVLGVLGEPIGIAVDEHKRDLSGLGVALANPDPGTAHDGSSDARVIVVFLPSITTIG